MVGRGKITIVTGAGSSGPGVGTGKAIAVQFAQGGLRVDIADAFGKQGISNIAPGIIVTPMQTQDIKNAGLDITQLDLGKGTALCIAGDAWDIARAALFLAGPDGRFITSQILAVDGGKTQTAH